VLVGLLITSSCLKNPPSVFISPMFGA